MFLGESEHVLNEGVEGGIFHPKGRGTASHPVEFDWAAIIEALIISLDIPKPCMDVLAERCDFSRQIMSVVTQCVPKDNMYERFDIVG